MINSFLETQKDKKIKYNQFVSETKRRHTQKTDPVKEIDKLTSMQNEIEDYKKNINKMKGIFKTKNEQYIISFNLMKSSLENEISNLQTELKEKNNTIKMNEDTIQTYQCDINNTKDIVDNTKQLLANISKLTQEINDLEINYKCKIETLEKNNNQLTNDNKQLNLSILKKEKELLLEKNKLENYISDNQTKTTELITQFTKQIEFYKNKLYNIEKQNEILNKNILELSSTYDTKCSEFKSIDSELRQLKSTYNKLFKQHEEAKLEKYNLSNEVLELSTKQQELLSLTNNYSKTIHQQKSTIAYQKEIIHKINENFDNTIIFKQTPTVYLTYQYNYFNNSRVTGLGDFIRACFYLLQLSDKYLVNVDFIINNHPLKKYINYFSEKPTLSPEISNSIAFFKEENHVYNTDLYNRIFYAYKDIDPSVLFFIRQTRSFLGNKYIYLTNHPNETHISYLHKERIKEILMPSAEITQLVDKTLHSMNLVKHKFRIVHVRLDDDSFNNINTPTTSIINYIVSYIKIILVENKDDVFLISNNNVIKTALLSKLPSVKTIFHDVAHVSQDCNDDIMLINTLKEFYIMSNSNYIHGFSIYDHGTGFSKWCATTYDIPYVCQSLKNI